MPAGWLVNKKQDFRVPALVIACDVFFGGPSLAAGYGWLGPLTIWMTATIML